jgi:hypothetical protein
MGVAKDICKCPHFSKDFSRLFLNALLGACGTAQCSIHPQRPTKSDSLEEHLKKSKSLMSFGHMQISLLGERELTFGKRGIIIIFPYGKESTGGVCFR